MPLHTGSIKYTATDTEPADTAGNSYYDLSEGVLKHYDGTSWATANTLVVSMKYNMCGTGSTTASLTNGGNDGTAQLTVTQEWNRVGQFNAKMVGYGV